MRAKHTALILTAGVLLLPTLSWSQFPGMGGGGPGGGGFGGGGRTGMQMDPNMLFNMLSGGQDVINVDQMNPQFRGMFDRFAPMLGLRGNQITREQFSGAMTRAREMMAAGGGGFGGGGMNFQMKTDAGGFGGGPMVMNLGGPGVPSDGGRDQRVQSYFNNLDLNENGLIEHHELRGREDDPVAADLFREFEKYDKNQDGAIDQDEFKAYMSARRGPQDRKDPNAPDAGDEDQRKRPTLVRAGNLPRDFPYAMLDKDGDGQIGLYEWKDAGRPIAEFLAMDLNNDGFLTVDEFYQWKKVQDEKNGVSASNMFAGRGRGMMPGMGGPGMGMPGMGGPNMFGGGNQGMGGPNMFAMGGPGMGRGPGGGGGPGGRGPGGGGGPGRGAFGSGGELGAAMNPYGGGGGQRNFGQWPGMSGDYSGFNNQQGNFGRTPGGPQATMPGFNPGGFNPGAGGGQFTPLGGGGGVRMPGGGGPNAMDNGGGGRPRGKGGNFDGSGGGGGGGGPRAKGGNFGGADGSDFGGGGGRPRGKGGNGAGGGQRGGNRR